jgi:predicted ATPase
MVTYGKITGLSESRFVGRDREFEEIKSYLDESMKGKGRLLFVIGEAGIGKSRLLDEFAAHAEAQGVIFLRGRCLYQENAEPYLPFMDALDEYISGRKMARKGDTDQESQVSEDFLSMGIVGFSDTSDRETEIAGQPVAGSADYVPMGLLPFDADDEAAAMKIKKIDIYQERTRLFEALSQLVIDISKERPLVLVIDDLQWADDGSLQLLHYLARNIQNAKVMIAGAYRPEELDTSGGETHALSKTLMRMRPEKLFYEIHLERFDEDSSAQMINSMLNIRMAPEPFTKRLYEESEGNPFFIEEVVKSLVTEGLIDLNDYTWNTSLDMSKIHIPGTIRDVIGRRIDKLNDSTRGILRYASIIGNQFTFETLFKLSESPEEELIDSIDELISANIIHEDTQSKEERYRFDHTQIREVVYNSMSRSRRRLLHKKIGYILEELNRQRLDDVIYNLAYHFYLGKDINKTLAYAVAAGEKATKTFAPEDAVSYYKMALEALDQLEKSKENKSRIVTLLKRLGELSFNVSEWSSALDYYRRSIVLCQDIDNPWGTAESYRKIGYVLNRMGDWDAATESFEKALAISEKMDDMFSMADAQRGLGYIHWRLGEYDHAIEHYNKCIKYSMDIQDMHTIALAFIEIGNVYIETGEIKLAIEYYNKSLKGLESMDDYSEMARAYNNLGDSNLKSGNYDEAIEYFAKCQDMGKKIGRKDIVGWSLFNAGEAYAKKGDAEQAMESAQKSLDILNIVGDKLGIMACYKIFGMAYGLKEEWELAIDSFEKCVALGEETNVPYIQGEVHFYYGKMYKQKGDSEQAKEQLNSALKIFEGLETEEFITRIKDELEDL